MKKSLNLFLSFISLLVVIVGVCHGQSHHIDPDHPENVDANMKIAVIGYHFRQESETTEDPRYSLALQSKLSWNRFANDQRYDFIWREHRNDVPAEMVEKQVHPRFYKYYFLAEVLRSKKNGGLGYDAAILFESDTIWTGSPSLTQPEEYLRSFPGAGLFLAHSFAIKPKELETGGYTYHLDPDYCGFKLDLGVILARGKGMVVRQIESIYKKALQTTNALESSLVLDAFPLLEVSSEEFTQHKPATHWHSFPLGTNFIASSLFWQPHMFAVHLNDEDKKISELKETLRIANKFNSLHQRSPEITHLEFNKLPLFPSRTASLLKSL